LFTTGKTLFFLDTASLHLPRPVGKIPVHQRRHLPMSKLSADTPLMQQHRAIKQKYPDAILLFRVGDFYETFGEDAIHASRILGITLTKRNNGSASSSELAGFPHHALDTYLHKLVKGGFRVAICDQLEDPRLAKGIVKRGVTEMVTPGTATQDKLLEHRSNNFLAAIHFGEPDLGIAFLDISTGEFFTSEGPADYIDQLLQTLNPAEVIFQRNHQKTFKETYGDRYYTYSLESWVFDETYARENLLRHFQTHSLKGFGIESLTQGIIAAGAIIHYLKDTEHPHLQHISSIQRLDRENYLWMDQFTVRNLELLPGGDQHFSLLHTLDNTVSPMGARLMKRWMLMPLKDIIPIRERLDLVDFFIREPELRAQLLHHIKGCGDMERMLARIPSKKINPREVLQLGRGLHEIEQIRTLCSDTHSPFLKRLSALLNPCLLMADQILAALVDNPPALAHKGNLVRPGVDAELDELRQIANGGKQYLAELQQKESVLTGISSLKIHFNNVFGYYLEVTNAQKHKVPETWIRKQTLVNAERYITPELKQYEEKITGAEEKIQLIEAAIYDKLLLTMRDYIAPIQVNCSVIATLDCLLCFAGNALRFNYKKPVIQEEPILELKESRHPVIEKNLPPGEAYISNDVLLDPTDQQIIILTGPNMSGKSALLRQVALITLMSHMGSFVPAAEAKIPLTDKIFTRVGASDNVSGGESTFLVEMNETASILNNITSRSLIILDEIGRGTSTYDGISIAWSIAEFLHQSAGKPKTLFATHYHELNELENKFPGIRNYHITSRELGNKIIFLRKLAAGGSTHSFGIHVAKMAGMPVSLIDRANQILKQLEDSRGGETTALKEGMKKIAAPQVQLSIFDAHTQTFEQIRKMISDMDINRLTPVEALIKLNEIKGLLQ
jgi:DNA mismatch repair protein MutS